MNERIIEVNNGRKIKLEFSEIGMRVTKVDSNGDIESRYQIDEGELVMLLNLYSNLQDDGTAYILHDFAKEILEHSGGIDYAEEYKIKGNY